MAQYTQVQYQKEDLPLDRISYEYIDGLNTHMQTMYKCHNNGAVNLLCCLQNFMLYAIRNEWIEKNPFCFYKMKIDKTNVKIPLTKAELDLLLKRPMPNERLFIIPKKTRTPGERETYTDYVGLQFPEYDSKLGHKELLDSITELVPKVEEERKKIAGSNNW